MALIRVSAFPLRILPLPRRVTTFIERACGQGHDSLGSVFLAGFECEAVEFEEKDADHKSRPLVAIDKRMVAHNSGCI